MRTGRQIIGWSAVAALIAATVYAPLFHVHSDGGEAPLVHAHLPEVESSEAEDAVHMERPHSHATARSIDLLTTVAGQFVQLDATLQSTALVLADPQPSRGFVAEASARAHAPPAVQSLIPRAPPA